MSVVGGHTIPSYKATKHIEHTFLMSHYCWYNTRKWMELMQASFNIIFVMRVTKCPQHKVCPNLVEWNRILCLPSDFLVALYELISPSI